MGRTRLKVLVAALLVFFSASGQAQDAAWDEAIDSARRAVASMEFDQAERILRRARARSQGFSTDDPRRIVPLMELARLHLGRGDYALPEALYREADPIARQAWGAESAEYAALLNDIGRYYHLRVKYAQAERFYKLAFGIRTRLLGREHPDVATSVNNLAVLYENLVLYPKAESYYRTALAIRQDGVGAAHPDTIVTLEHFARLLHKMSRPDEAAPLEERALAYRRARSPPGTASSPQSSWSARSRATPTRRASPTTRAASCCRLTSTWTARRGTPSCFGTWALDWTRRPWRPCGSGGSGRRAGGMGAPRCLRGCASRLRSA